MIPITDSRSRMWRCWLAFGLLSYFLSLFLSRLSVCLFDSFFLSFFLSSRVSGCFPFSFALLRRGGGGESSCLVLQKTHARATKWWKESKGRRKESKKAQKHLKRSCAHDTPSPLPLLPPFFLTCSRYSR